MRFVPELRAHDEELCVSDEDVFGSDGWLSVETAETLAPWFKREVTVGLGRRQDASVFPWAGLSHRFWGWV